MQVSRIVNMLAVGSIVVGTSTACATKKFVRTEVEAVGTRVETLSQSLEATQEATRENGTRITAVDAKADQVGIWAKEAQTSATNANTAVVAVETKLASKIDAVDASNKRLVYEVVISEDQGQFKFGSTALPEAVQQRIDQMITDLKANPRGNYVEIEGHTDSSGDKLVNQRIGEQRAEAVKRYLYETHQVPLHKMNVISWGEDKPVGPNNTRDGRAQNRRVVIRVLA
jgi:outer membrane protein OmpA-like peptidoglycan-associated protein